MYEKLSGCIAKRCNRRVFLFHEIRSLKPLANGIGRFAHLVMTEDEAFIDIRIGLEFGNVLDGIDKIAVAGRGYGVQGLTG